MKKNNLQNILKELSKTDDMKKSWPKYDILFSLGFTETIRNSICEWYWGDKETVTLEDVFEVVISSEKDPRTGYLITKMLDLRCVGIKTFLKVVNSFSEIDFGKKCNIAWRKKQEMFMSAHRVKGSREHSWSSPITEEGKGLAKFRNGTPYVPRRRKIANNKLNSDG
ncbi:hypothetical protein DESC_270003 [Desulfosarcina cetonica]|uniref:hypothetical protein n=1 Tax=Desulfosarcina cetonica TaxID=90730 RepID=UPI0006D0A772|nr:hypothetical protein [Desulfosarcina cetonica]VTR64856.1 hypothetical protein DESC_270003 [Desulfosarcina cetonica]